MAELNSETQKELVALRAEIERLQHQNRLFRKALSFVASYRSLHPDSRNLVASHMSSVANEALEGKP